MVRRIDYLVDGPGKARLTLALAHGAGAGMDSPFMVHFAERIAAAAEVRVARFEFPYMARRRAEGGRRPPDRQPVLLDAWRRVAAELGAANLVVGGKSMGGRMASLIADETGARGLVCLGYPFGSIRELYASPCYGGGEAGSVIGAGGEADEVEPAQVVVQIAGGDAAAGTQ